MTFIDRGVFLPWRHNNTTLTLWVAVDVAKQKHDVLIEYPNGTHKQLVIANTIEDFKKLMLDIATKDLPNPKRITKQVH